MLLVMLVWCNRESNPSPLTYESRELVAYYLKSKYIIIYMIVEHTLAGLVLTHVDLHI